MKIIIQQHQQVSQNTIEMNKIQQLLALLLIFLVRVLHLNVIKKQQLIQMMIVLKVLK